MTDRVTVDVPLYTSSQCTLPQNERSVNLHVVIAVALSNLQRSLYFKTIYRTLKLRSYVTGGFKIKVE